MQPGDIIQFGHRELPLTFVEAVVVEVGMEIIDVFSPMIAPFEHDGLFQREEMTDVVVRCAAPAAIVEGSRNRFTQGQRVRCQHGVGHVVAAYQGIVIARRDDGEQMSGGINAFEAAAASGDDGRR